LCSILDGNLWPREFGSPEVVARERRLWSRALSGQISPENHRLLMDGVLVGVGSGGPGFNTYRPDELGFLISLVRNLKQKNQLERQHILTDYDAFLTWIPGLDRVSAPQR
jgi:hypothetical protein